MLMHQKELGGLNFGFIPHLNSYCVFEGNQWVFFNIEYHSLLGCACGAKITHACPNKEEV